MVNTVSYYFLKVMKLFLVLKEISSKQHYIIKKLLIFQKITNFFKIKLTLTYPKKLLFDLKKNHFFTLNNFWKPKKKFINMNNISWADLNVYFFVSLGFTI